MNKVIAERVTHDGGSRVALRFPYDDELIPIVRMLPGAKWSKEMKCWHIPEGDDVINLLLDAFHKKAFVDYSALKSTLADRVRVAREEKKQKAEAEVEVKEEKQGSNHDKFPPLSEHGRADIER